MEKQLQVLSVEEQEEKEKKQAVMDMMSGKEGLEVFTRELEKRGIKLPHRDVWKHATREGIATAAHATFSLLGGVPGMVLWS